MEEMSSVRELLPRLVRRPPADLAAVLAMTLLVNGVVFVPVLRETALRVPIGLAFVLFVPGYAVVSAIFPQKGPSDTFGTGDDETTRPLASDDGHAEPSPEGEIERPRSWWRTIDGIDRIALSVALSVVVVPVVGVVMSFRAGFQFGPTLGAVSAGTVIATAAAMQRRSAVPPEERFRIPYRAWLLAVRTTVFEPDTRKEVVLNVALIGAVLLALVSVGYAATVLPQDDEYSTVHVLPAGEAELDGEEPLLEIEPGASQEVTIGVDNREGRTVTYTVVVLEQEVQPGGEAEEEANRIEQRELDRFETQVENGETWRHDHDVEPTPSDERVRIAWLLYVDGDVPNDPSVETADYHVHTWTADSGA